MKTALLWNTYGKDIEWFDYSVRSYRKFATGFDEAVCLVPDRDRHLFEEPCKRNGIRLDSREEWPGLGFNWHQMFQCCADLLIPGADAIWHIDSDTVFTQPVTPETWMEGGKLICSFFTFAHLNAIAKTPEHPGIWKSRVDAALGGDVRLATMVRPPYCHYREVYEATRALVGGLHHPEGFEAYVKSCQNDFPQGFAEFETLGAVAQTLFYEQYVWRDVDRFGSGGHPSDGKILEGWSWGGLDAVTDRFGGTKTARQAFAEAGL